ncbi:MAG: DNA repair protein RecN [Bacteroidetes bacterium]|nr:DNA repair protein RecN [Bacteroidota bacterium]
MLETLHIKNFALIDDLTLTFTKGLNILSGETGAGKSILIGAISLILGVRGDSTSVRTGSKETIVTAVVRIPDDLELRNWLKDHGIECDDNSIIIKRIVRINGRSSIFIQSEQMTLKDLQFISKYLFDMHGQHEHQSILYEESQRKLLDSYGKLSIQVMNYGVNYDTLRKLRQELASFHTSERETIREKDMLEYAVREIELAVLLPNEDLELQEELHRLSQSEQLTEYIAECSRILYGDSNPGVISLVKSAQKSLSEALSIDGRLEQVEKQVENSLYELEDAYDFLRQYRDSIDFSPERIDAIQERLQLIKNLMRKYGNTILEVLEYRDKAVEKLSDMDNEYADRDELEKVIAKLEIELSEMAVKLSQARKYTAERLGPGIKKHLALLGMPQAEFTVEVVPDEIHESVSHSHSYGIDTVFFKISPNIGEPAKELKGVASGGELSRIMLAVKTVFSENDTIETLIFDEIDAGIGGAIASSVGDHLSKLAQKRQVLCITHLASIAVKADTHFSVYKREQNLRTITEVRRLGEDERVAEIARMLSGNSSADSAIAHARDLLQAKLR